VRLSERIIVLKDHQKIGEIVNGRDVTAQQVVDIIAAHGLEAAAESGIIDAEADLHPVEAAHATAPVPPTMEEDS